MTSGPASTLACAGCGAPAPRDDPRPFRCQEARAGDDTDHVMARWLDLERVRFPGGGAPNPFVRYRELLHSYHTAIAGGLTDADYVALVEHLDRAVAAVGGRGFAVTPFARSNGLSERLGFAATGGLWVKDETGNVAGSHKARHLMGIALYLAVAERLGRVPSSAEGAAPLAIASCGNAALAAAVMARAMGRSLDVFIPTGADPKVVERLQALDARIAVCGREPGVAGDPCVHRFRRAVEAGGVPFCCQGSENGLTIEGGETLGYEIISELSASRGMLDRLFVQVGGGALASACVQALREAVAMGVLPSMPRIHAVQTRGAYPLVRAFERVRARVLERLGDLPLGEDPPARRSAAAADLMCTQAASSAVREELRYATTHRSEFMWPWEETPRSVAHGILDDETYDWHAVVSGMIESGGWPVVVAEDLLKETNGLARAATGANVDHTGSAGLAGLVELRGAGLVAPEERVAVLFTGAER